MDESVTHRQVAELCDLEEGMTGWEVEFIETCSQWIRDYRPLTARQEAKVDQIWRKLIAGETQR